MLTCNKQSRFGYVSYFLLIIFSVFFLFILISNIHSPGVWNDEAWVIKEAKDIIYNRHFPVIEYEHPVTIRSYLSVPFLILFGVSISSLRLLPIFSSLVTVWLIYYLCRSWFGSRVGFITAMLTITNLAFVQYTKIGAFYAESLVVFFFWLSIFCLWKYILRRKNFYLFLAFFIFGLALSMKITFLAYIVGMAVVYLIWREKINLVVRLRFRHWMIAFFSFCLGNYLLIRFNIKKPFVTFKLLINSLTHPTSDGCNNLFFLKNFDTRLEQLYQMFSGKIEESFGWGVIKTNFIEHLGSFIYALLVISFIIVFLVSFFKKTRFIIHRTKVSILYVFYAIVFICACFTVFSMREEHLFVLFPFPQLVMALSLEYLYYRFKKNPFFLIPVYSVFFILPIIFNTSLNIHYNSQMEKNGGSGVWSIAIYDLIEYLQKNKISNPICFFQEPVSTIQVLSNNEVEPVLLGGNEKCFQFFRASPKASRYLDNLDSIKKLMVETYEKHYFNKQNYFYIITNDPVENEFSEFESLKMFAKDYNKRPVLEKIFYNKISEPIYYLYQVTDIGKK